jgi:parvulin-like peptidyl-prolyl isomerase
MADQNKKPNSASRKHVARLEHDRRQVAIVRTVAFAMFGVIALLIGYGALDTYYLQKQKPVAEVNGEKIAIGEWQERIQMQRANLVNSYQVYQFYQANFGGDYTQQFQQIESYINFPQLIGQQVLDQMVDEALVRQEAEKRGITVTDEEVEKYIQENSYHFFPNGTPVPTVTPTAFASPSPAPLQLTLYPHTATPTTAPTSTPEPTSTPDLSPTATMAPPTPTFIPEAATATATPYTLDGYKAEYQKTLDEYKGYGVSETTFRAVYRNIILRDKLEEVITADVPTTGEQVWARHILVADEGTAKTVKALLDNGTDFAEVAKQYSTDTGSAVNGGDLGWFGKGKMVPEFETAAFSQEIGAIGEPVQSQFGYHIIQVLDKQQLPLNANDLKQNRDTAFNDWLTLTRDEADVVPSETWTDQIPPMPAGLSLQQSQ